MKAPGGQRLLFTAPSLAPRIVPCTKKALKHMWMTDRQVKGALPFHWYPTGPGSVASTWSRVIGINSLLHSPNPSTTRVFWQGFILLHLFLSHVLLPWDVVFFLMEVIQAMPGQLSCVSVFPTNRAELSGYTAQWEGPFELWSVGDWMRREFALCLYRILDALPGRLPELENS